MSQDTLAHCSKVIIMQRWVHVVISNFFYMHKEIDLCCFSFQLYYFPKVQVPLLHPRNLVKVVIIIR